MKATLQKIVAYIIDAAEPEQILLFGSVADGKHSVHSDIDLLIITKDKYLSERVVAQVTCFIREFGMSADILVRSEEEIKRSLSMPYSFLGSVAKNAKILYKKK